MHGQLFTKHSPHGTGDIKKWPVSKKVEEFLLKCDGHKEDKVEMFCKDHTQLCCRKCALFNHRQCKAVMLLSDLVKNTSTDLKQVSVTIQTTLAQLKELQDKLQDSQEANFRSLQSSFDEQLHKIQETREQIIAALDILEKKTLTEMKDTLTKMQASHKSDIDKCATFRDELKQLKDVIEHISDKSKLELSFITSIKCVDKIQLFEKYRTYTKFVQVKSSITFLPNRDIVQYLSTLSSLGRIEDSRQTATVLEISDQVMKMEGKSEYDYKGEYGRDCSIRDILVLPDGLVLLADKGNETVKLLNQQFKLVSQCKVSGKPGGLCQITPSEVGVTVGKEIQFIKINNSQLVTDRKLQLQHECFCISHHQGDLFVTSYSALYKYSKSGKLFSKLHNVKGVNVILPMTPALSLAVSPKGDKLYIADPFNNNLLTLAMDGSVLATFKDPELKSPIYVHVTPAGQVLVCGHDSSTILQVDREGSRKLATLATVWDGLQDPWSVCYNSSTASIIVGQNNKILVYKVK
ncbi:uncharacterized protein LOC127840902 [Dreissena polymorpha]|uniref:uncharacterized protein LOC127840902 n=1 Tax=Dreissena polymorpha TaxID=45954 RepID=UPI002264208E|nr:uncharacterized protein LOC127840902 [Dreissena polymorpha]